MKFSLAIEKVLAATKALQAQTSTEYEQQLRRESTIACVRKCSHCCYYPFLVSISEGVLVYRWLRTHGHWTPFLRKKIEAHQDKTLGLSLEIWLLSTIACPLLESNECVAYEVRPLHCRATYSIGDPAMCHPHALGENTYLTQSSEVVIEYSVALQVMLKRIGVAGFLMPLSEAILLSAAIETGNSDFATFGLQYLKDFSHG